MATTSASAAVAAIKKPNAYRAGVARSGWLYPPDSCSAGPTPAGASSSGAWFQSRRADIECFAGVLVGNAHPATEQLKKLGRALCGRLTQVNTGSADVRLERSYSHFRGW
jgi:hypothetical protein